MAARKKSTKRRTTRRVVRASSSNQNLLILAIALVIGIAGYIFYNSQYNKPVEKETKTPRKLVVTLNAQNKSGESGTATISEMDAKVKVMLDLTGAPKDVQQPAHIHMGACPKPGDVKYPLAFPVDGKSETTLDVGYDQLLGQLPLAVNVHKSTNEAKAYVSCGDITRTY